MKNITFEFPQEIIDDGGELYLLDMDDKIKVLMINKNRNYRRFRWVIKTPEKKSLEIETMINMYKADNAVYSERQKMNMGIV
jgi:hypothetical protein